MKLKLGITVVFCTLSLVCAASAGAALSAHGPSAVPEAEAAPSPREEGYLLAEVEGMIGVFRGGELVCRTDISVYGLPEADRLLLREGLPAGSYDQVLGLLEDFSS